MLHFFFFFFFISIKLFIVSACNLMIFFSRPILTASRIGYLRPNLEYTVWYRLTDAPEWRTLRIVQKNVMEATIQHLLPGREYEFMVLSQDKYGDGMFSKQFRFSTQRKFNSIDYLCIVYAMQLFFFVFFFFFF